MKNKEYDIIVLGAGPAGITAAIYAARYRLKVLVVGKEIGGMINYSNLIENYPGFVGSGMELAKKFVEQAKKFGSEILQEEIVDITRNKEGKFEVRTLKNNTIMAKAIIFSLGTEKRRLNIKGEKELLGKGVSYCALCDAPLFKDKTAVVIGGRNSAAHAALLLSKYAKNVYIVYRGDSLKCDEFLAGEIKKHDTIKLIFNSLPVEVKGKGKVEGIFIESNGKKEQIQADGIFVEAGSVPASSLAERLGIKTNKEGYLIVDDEMKTNTPAVFCAGDITQGNIKQVIIAAAQGCIAASSAYKFLKSENKENTR